MTGMTDDRSAFSQVYHDPETGKPITTHSMIKTMRHCPKQAEYKYVERLKPRVLGRPLRFGTWMHSLYEAYHKGEDWKAVHRSLTNKYSQLFDEEKEELGDLPRDCARTMVSYLWHYRDDPWIVHEVEFTIEAELPDGGIYRGKVDMLVEDQYGLWIVDHKNHKTLPGLEYRIMDAQSALYIWAARRAGYDIQGHIWNYVRSTPPGVPKLLKDGSRLSRARLETDYPTLLKTIRHHGLNPDDYRDWLNRLKAQRYQHGEPQTSPFFRRDVLEKDSAMLKRVATEAYATHLRMHSYHWDKPGAVERNPGRDCRFMCSYVDLCTMELFGGNSEFLRRTKFTVGDPMDYYYDNEKPVEVKRRG